MTVLRVLKPAAPHTYLTNIRCLGFQVTRNRKERCATHYNLSVLAYHAWKNRQIYKPRSLFRPGTYPPTSGKQGITKQSARQRHCKGVQKVAPPLRGNHKT
eukprot:4703162-Amphidinium_carterae.1